MNNLKQHIASLFKKTKYSDKDGNLFTNTILESIENIEISLIEILLKDKEAKKHFFTKVLDTYVLNQIKLIDFFSMNNYFEKSYTSYTNKIGLIRKDDFIKRNNDVVLAYPHKDCVLEGGQSKDHEKGKENFFNEILNANEIDRLFEPKVLTNIKEYTKDGIEANLIISDEDNLIIKGNNLLALHSLKKKYAGKVKLIYIDPPYNTGNDSFGYNDNFNYSTWLTFMKNRLEVAREFLIDDGVIFVQCDDNEQAYLKVLMDEIFGRDSFVTTLHVEMSTTQGMKVASAQNGNIVKNCEYIIIFSKLKNKSIAENIIYDLRDFDNHYSYWFDGENYCKLKKIISDNKNLYNLLKNINLENSSIESMYKESNAIKKFIVKNAKFIYQDGNAAITIPKKIKDSINATFPIEYILNDKKYFLIRTSGGTIRQLMSLSSSIQIANDIKNSTGITKIRGDLWKDYYRDMMNVSKEGDNLGFKNGKKPERLLKDLILLAINPNDLVMDFFAGSGTTSAVAHKMGRRYIGIEQMDYIENITVERMKKVINGEQGGISKSVNWQGGGSFIYAELKQIDNFNKSNKKLKQEMHYLPINELEDDDYKISKEEMRLITNSMD